MMPKFPKLINNPIAIAMGKYLGLSTRDLFGENHRWSTSIKSTPMSEAYAFTRKIEIVLGRSLERL